MIKCRLMCILSQIMEKWGADFEKKMMNYPKRSFLVSRQHPPPPPSNLILAVPRRLFCFWFLSDFRCSVPSFIVILVVFLRTAQKDNIIDKTSDSQVTSNFQYRWSPASLTFNNYFYILLYLYITRITINKNTPH